MDYEIISTGSKGNCVIAGSVMIDCGVAFKQLKDACYDVDTLLLTHIHSDHVNKSTLKNIVSMFPHIKIYGNYEVSQVFSEYPITVINAGVPFTAPCGITFEPFACVHDVVTYGYRWTSPEGEEVIYATDTADMRHSPSDGRKYDYLFLESNHCEKKLELLTSSRAFGYNVIAGAKRHQSTQTAKTYYYMNRKSPDSKFIELHQSSRFY